MRKSSQLFHDRLLLGRFFRGFVLPVLEYRFDLWCSAADTHLKLLDRVVNGAIFLTKSVFDCTSSVCGSILYAVQDKVSDAPSLWCSTCAVCRCDIGTLMSLLAAEPRSTAGPSFHCKYLCGTILATPYSMVWDWRVSRAGPISFYWPSCSLPFCLLLFSLPLLSFYGLVLWGCVLRTDRVLIALSQPCKAGSINNESQVK